MSLAEVILYERPGCHLCEDALTVLQDVRREHPFRLTRIDIETDDALFKRYLERIPVVTLNGGELFQFFADATVLQAALAEARPRPGANDEAAGS